MPEPRLLVREDIPALMRLKEAANWNQTVEDWERVLALEPEGCFGIECDGVLAASATAVCYGTGLAWIGMVLTLPEFRGRGLARRLMERSIEFAEQRGVGWMKLDATDMGAPLYAKLGFEPECAVERHMRAPALVYALGTQQGSFDLALDLRAFGADRGQLLHTLAAEAPPFYADSGYALGRAGSRAAYFGPCVAKSSDAARHMLEQFLSQHPDQPVAWDLLPDNKEAVRIAAEHGFTVFRKLVRMARRGRGNRAPLGTDSALTFAIAGFEYG